jgi:hypothetical protein
MIFWTAMRKKTKRKSASEKRESNRDSAVPIEVNVRDGRHVAANLRFRSNGYRGRDESRPYIIRGY